jgi:hypothetical protein
LLTSLSTSAPILLPVCPAAPDGYILSPYMEHFGEDLSCDSSMDAEAAGIDCMNVPDCMAFTLVLPLFDGNPRRCFKSSASPLQSAPGICFYTKREFHRALVDLAIHRIAHF